MTTTPGPMPTIPPPMTPAQCADATAELVRAINHATRSGVVAGADDGGLGQVGDAYDTVAGLALMASRLPQALVQLRTFLTTQAQAGRVVAVDEDGHRIDPGEFVEAATSRLGRAAREAATFADTLDTAQQNLAALGHRST